MNLPKVKRGRHLIDLTGQTFGELTVEYRASKVGTAVYWLCSCTCGNELTVLSGNLRAGVTKSCGCWANPEHRGTGVKHGLFGTPRYALWNGASKRSRRKGIPFTITIHDVPEIPGVCPVLGIPMARSYGAGGVTFNSPTLDRTIPDLGYVPGNIDIISQRANVIKNDATPEEVQMVADYMREKMRPILVA